jgi:hypothetical protein
MTNLFRFVTKYGATYCFANDAKEAENIILKEKYENRLMYSHTIEEVSGEMLKEDGVEFLREKDFVGIPQQKVFMLTGSVMHSTEHYFNKKRSSTLWWSEKIPESENLWSAEFV